MADMKNTAIAATVVLMAIAPVSGQQPLFKRTVLQQQDISAPGRQAVMALGEFQPGGGPGPHTHPGEEISYVIEGSVVLEQTGRPNVTVKAGESFIIPAGVVHNATNRGTGIAKIVATYVIEKGKPLASPASAR
jgi:quercetin dioxygenase-like cupin family protein